ncbi:hypothetical protein CDL15_Pgr024614 [Punica granatum]|uniref:Sister chromatid cohesion protein DCC1 n=1 Tax=Punica granatum TaxID=22663 RepID=A0A218W6I4_PUNGR|nr:hypothetical protein CDL15_Pgr024614 [Punica granatum]
MEQHLMCPKGGAGSVLNLNPGSALSIAYHTKYGPHDDILLLELDEKLLPDVTNQRVFLRGQPDEDAVLCTQSKTYAIKFVGTSNSVCLVPPSNQSETGKELQDCAGNGCDHEAAIVIKLASGSMEIVEVAPRLDKLKSLLSQAPYGIEEASEMEVEGMERDKTGLYKWDDLVNEVQASDEELRSGLQALSAVEIDGYWRIIDNSYMDMILRMLLHNSVLMDWPLNALDQDEVFGVLASDGFPRKVAHHCLSMYGDKSEEDGSKCIWKLDEKRVCVHFARNILREGKMKMEKFIEEWSRRIPPGMEASLQMLDGEVLTEKLGIDTWVRGFSVSSLPSTPSERFSILFKERPRWDWKDLQPYIRDLSIPGLSLEGLLLKYTRRVQPSPDAEPVFTAR